MWVSLAEDLRQGDQDTKILAENRQLHLWNSKVSVTEEG